MKINGRQKDNRQKWKVKYLLLFLLKDSNFVKKAQKLKGFNIVVIQKLLSEFFVFVHELINSTCSVN
jgi:hypothetical protein